MTLLAHDLFFRAPDQITFIDFFGRSVLRRRTKEILVENCSWQWSSKSLCDLYFATIQSFEIVVDFQDKDDFPKIAHYNELSSSLLISARKVFVGIGRKTVGWLWPYSSHLLMNWSVAEDRGSFGRFRCHPSVRLPKFDLPPARPFACQNGDTNAYSCTFDQHWYAVLSAYYYLNLEPKEPFSRQNLN